MPVIVCKVTIAQEAISDGVNGNAFHQISSSVRHTALDMRLCSMCSFNKSRKEHTAQRNHPRDTESPLLNSSLHGDSLNINILIDLWIHACLCLRVCYQCRDSLHWRLFNMPNALFTKSSWTRPIFFFSSASIYKANHVYNCWSWKGTVNQVMITNIIARLSQVHVGLPLFIKNFLSQWWT